MRSARVRTEKGTGMLGTALGAVVFLAFLTLATHILVGLYATSVLTSVAWDDAKLIAAHPNDQEQDNAARADVQQRLKGFKDVRVDVVETDSDVAFHVSAQRPNFLPAGLTKVTSLGRISCTVHIRPEKLR